MADADQSYSLEIDATPEDCMAVLLDFPAYPQWSGPLTFAKVLEQDAAGRGRIVEFKLDMKLREIRYVLEYEYDGSRQARWHSVDGDVSSVTGSYEFQALGPGRTKATCKQSIDLGFWVPGPLRRLAERQALRDSVSEFKAEVERRRA